MDNLEVVGKVISKAMSPRSPSTPHALALLQDETGSIRLSLWGRQIEQVNQGDVIRLKRAFARWYRGKLELATWEENIEVITKGRREVDVDKDRQPQVLLEKRLSSNEIRQNQIYIPTQLQDHLRPGSVVSVRVAREMVSMKINRWGMMNPERMLWDRFARLLHFDKEHDTLTFLKHKDGSIEIACKKSERGS